MQIERPPIIGLRICALKCERVPFYVHLTVDASTNTVSALIFIFFFFMSNFYWRYRCSISHNNNTRDIPCIPVEAILSTPCVIGKNKCWVCVLETRLNCKLGLSEVWHIPRMNSMITDKWQIEGNFEEMSARTPAGDRVAVLCCAGPLASMGSVHLFSRRERSQQINATLFRVIAFIL